MNSVACWGGTGYGDTVRPSGCDRSGSTGWTAFFARHGGLSVLFAHFLHVGRALMPFLAGASRLPYLRFLVYNATGCFLWATIFSLVGYLFGQNWHLVERWIGRAEYRRHFHWHGRGHDLALALDCGPRNGDQALVGAILCEPRVANFRLRFARHIDWLEQRLSPQGYLGIHLTVGIFLLLAAVATFGGLLQRLGRGTGVTADLQVAGWFAMRPGGPSTAMHYIAHLRSAVWLATLVLAAVLISRRERHCLRLLLIAAPGGVLLNFLLKQLFARERPHFRDALGRGISVGPLDGDLMITTVVYGALAYVLVRGFERWHWRLRAIAATILLILLVALSSLYFGASQLSNVVAAMIEGAALLLFCISGVEIVRWRENARGSPN